MEPIVDERVDENGRVEIPPDFQEVLQIGPGDAVTIELVDDRIEIRPQISREKFTKELQGCINAETRATDTEPTNPLDMKFDWTDDLPE